ncbi:hypothetical protein A11A3_11723 [Alcanivorax hongdengensis A-11-3]|uniref:DUF3617 domain-containing protein n=1 Tax=Alcanivorax hongdengensis A-11-3 TaxID=1177179 RepID=L0WA90_9GAMM|nr:DUF3617 family protein [Alcanivorax hongdengensis]EKF73876.1 hypothetical protein A11A3_11723 [Alcanivorax hongdengensis A-11-3]
MKKNHLFLTAALFFLAAPGLAADLKPGQWEVKQRMTGDQAPPGMNKEKTKTRCITAEEAKDTEEALRQKWMGSGCDNPEMDWDGDTLKWQTQCQSGKRTLSSSGTMNVEDEEHYSTEITTGTERGKLTIKAEARWIGPCNS